MSENAERRAARMRLQAQYRALYDEVVDILFEADPIGVHVHHNVEKFVPEATSILARRVLAAPQPGLLPYPQRIYRTSWADAWQHYFLEQSPTLTRPTYELPPRVVGRTSRC